MLPLMVRLGLNAIALRLQAHHVPVLD